MRNVQRLALIVVLGWTAFQVMGCGLTTEERLGLVASGQWLQAEQRLYVAVTYPLWEVKPEDAGQYRNLINFPGLAFAVPDSYDPTAVTRAVSDVVPTDPPGDAHQYLVSLRPRKAVRSPIEVVWQPWGKWQAYCWDYFAGKGLLTGSQLRMWCGGEWQFVQDMLTASPAQIDLRRLGEGDLSQRMKVCLLKAKEYDYTLRDASKIEKFTRGDYSGFVIFSRVGELQGQEGIGAAIYLAHRSEFVGVLRFGSSANEEVGYIREIAKAIVSTVRVQ